MAYTRFDQIPNFSTAAVTASALSLDPTYNNDSLLGSALVTRSARLDALANAASETITVPFLNPLDATIESNVASKDESIRANVNGIKGGTQSAITHFRDQVWGANRLLSGLKGVDIMSEIAAKDERYWIDERKKMLAIMLKAISIVSPANMTADASGNVANLKALLQGKQTFGDAKSKVKNVVMSSLQHYYIQESQIGYEQPSQTDTEFGRIAGMNIVVSDDMPDDLLALVADGGFVYGEASQMSSPRISYQSDELLARGWGVDALVSRRQFIFTPQGYKFVGTYDSQNASPTFDEMKNGNDWELVTGIPRKALPFGFVKVAITPTTTGE